MPATVAGIHLGPDTHANRPAADAAGLPVGSLYLCSDHNLIYKTDGSSWSTWATLGGSGIPESLLDAKGDIIAASAADTAARLAAGANDTVLTADSSTATGLKWAAPGGGGGLTQAYVGYNTIGATWETMTGRRVYMKKITLANACLVTDIEAYIDWGGTPENGGTLGVAIMADNSGSPREVLQYTMSPPDSIVLDHLSGAGGVVARWFGSPMGRWLTAGDYWLGVAMMQLTSVSARIARDTSGSDRYYAAGANFFTDAGFYAVTTTTDRYSIRANTIR